MDRLEVVKGRFPVELDVVIASQVLLKQSAA